MRPLSRLGFTTILLCLSASPWLASGCGNGNTGFRDDDGDALAPRGDAVSEARARGADAGADDAKAGDAPADGPAPWPDCNTQPPNVPTKTIPQIWAANYSTETQVWISGAYVTGVSGGACSAGRACQFFVQDATSYANLSAAAKHGIKVFVSAATASYFTGVRAGDRVDVMGWAWRYDVSGEHELLVQVNAALPGCFKKVGAGVPTPVAVSDMSPLTVAGYEDTYGPVLVQVSNVSGRPDPTPTTTFGIWPTGAFPEGSIPQQSVSPYFLQNGAFTSLYTDGGVMRFTSITGVFGLFVPASDGGAATKYVEIYPRTMSEIVVQ
jgi:hypothetical protein